MGSAKGGDRPSYAETRRWENSEWVRVPVLESGGVFSVLGVVFAIWL